MIKDEYFGKIVEITDTSGRTHRGKVGDITSSLDSDSGENEIAIEQGNGLVEFKESEIVSIKM